MSTLFPDGLLRDPLVRLHHYPLDNGEVGIIAQHLSTGRVCLQAEFQRTNWQTLRVGQRPPASAAFPSVKVAKSLLSNYGVLTTERLRLLTNWVCAYLQPVNASLAHLSWTPTSSLLYLHPRLVLEVYATETGHADQCSAETEFRYLHHPANEHVWLVPASLHPVDGTYVLNKPTTRRLHCEPFEKRETLDRVLPPLAFYLHLKVAHELHLWRVSPQLSYLNYQRGVRLLAALAQGHAALQVIAGNAYQLAAAQPGALDDSLNLDLTVIEDQLHELLGEIWPNLLDLP